MITTYYLTKHLLQRLEQSNDSISSIFSDVNGQRDNIIAGNNPINGNKTLVTRVDYKNRGINSKDVNIIINKALSFAESEAEPEIIPHLGQ